MGNPSGGTAQIIKSESRERRHGSSGSNLPWLFSDFLIQIWIVTRNIVCLIIDCSACSLMHIMGQRKWPIVAILISLSALSCARELRIKHKHIDHLPVYNHTLATILVRSASAVYISDLTELFIWTCSRCDGLMEGFVGVTKDLNAIVIAFRGTQECSIWDWIEDLYWKQLDLNYPGMADAMGHHGFYSAYHNTTVSPGALNASQRTKNITEILT